MTQRGAQIAALPLTLDKQGDVMVLLITSRDTGRWVVPKGWEMAGKKPWIAAGIEALEEAGVSGPVQNEPLGRYRYSKIMKDGSALRCDVRGPDRGSRSTSPAHRARR